jgi:hypothetical protein
MNIYATYGRKADALMLRMTKRREKVKLLRLHFMVYWIGLNEKMTKHDNKIVIIVLIFRYFIIHISHIAGDINVELGKDLTTSNWEIFVFIFDLKKMVQEWLKLC